MIEVRIQKSFARSGYDIWLFERRGDLVSVARPLEIVFDTPKSDAFLLPDPTLHIKRDDFNSLADSIKKELIGNGWAPQAEMLEGELKATKSHLADMQRIVFKGYK